MSNSDELYKDISATIQQSVKSCYEGMESGGWREDNITYQILKDIKALDFSRHLPTGYASNISWNAFKQSGIPEEESGDLAVIIKLRFSDEAHLEGVAFIEAKRFYPGEGFVKLDLNQLRTHLQTTPMHRTILYYPTNIEGHVQYRANTLPSRHVLTIGNKSNKLKHASEPFAATLLIRYFMGCELDHSPDLIELAKGFATTPNPYRYVLTATIDRAPGLDPEPIIVNDSVFKACSTHGIGGSSLDIT